MPTLGNYYIDAPNLASASAVYTDAAMTTPAGNGYYSDGSIVRQQVGGVLQVAISCPTCTQPCSTAIGYSASGTEIAVYEIPFNLGPDPGCAIIYFNPGFGPEGIKVSRAPNVYNQLTSPNYGYLASNTPGNYTFLGRTSQDCGIALQLAGGGYSGLQQFEWSGSNFVLTGTLGTITGDPFDVKLTANDPGYCTLYIPQSASSVDNISVQIASPCETAIFDVEVNCPILLTGVASSVRLEGDVVTLCNNVSQYPNVYYNVPNYGGTAGCPALYEFFVQDPYGNNKVPAGRYKIPAGPCGGAKILTVDSNGVIIGVHNC